MGANDTEYFNVFKKMESLLALAQEKVELSIIKTRILYVGFNLSGIKNA